MQYYLADGFFARITKEDINKLRINAVIRSIMLITACLVYIHAAGNTAAAAVEVASAAAAAAGAAAAAEAGSADQSIRRVYNGRDYIITETEVVGDYSASEQRYPS